MSDNKQDNQQQRRGRWKLFAVIAVCASPLIFSYLTYYVIKPEGRTNYGDLLDPRLYPIPVLGSTTLDGKPAELDTYKGQWLMVQVDASECLEPCQKKLINMRQLRLMQGKEMERIERVWLITDGRPIETMLMRQFDGTRLLRAKLEAVRTWLPVEPGTTAADHIYLVDPMGNLMMRFPKDADPNKIKKDLSKVLRASSIG